MKYNYSSKIGKNVLIMTATHYWLGRVVAEDVASYHLDRSAWIPNIGRHSTVMLTGKQHSKTECEMHPPGMIISVPRFGSTVFEWPYDLWEETVNPENKRKKA